MDIEKIMQAFSGNEDMKSVILYIEPFIPVLTREDEEVFELFVEYVSEGKWVELDELLWPLMTEDERDKLHELVHQSARITVQNLFDSEQIARKVLLKVVTSLIGLI